MPPELSTAMERFGSFGLIAVALVWGGPKLLAFLREQRMEFTAAIREMRTDHATTIAALVARHEARIDVIYKEHSEWQRATNGVVSQLADRVGAMGALIEAARHHQPAAGAGADYHHPQG
jgi:hypothetical protein